MHRIERVRNGLRKSGSNVLLFMLPVLLDSSNAATQEAEEELPWVPEAALSRLEAGQRLRVELLEGLRRTGRFRDQIGDCLTMHDGAVVGLLIPRWVQRWP